MTPSATDASRNLVDLASRLEQQLREEHAALTARDSEALLRIAGVKSDLVSALENGSRGLAWDQLGAHARQQLQECLGACRQHNLANAALLDARRSQVQWALRFLGVADGDYYGANGAAVTRFSGRAVGVA